LTGLFFDGWKTGSVKSISQQSGATSADVGADEAEGGSVRQGSGAWEVFCSFVGVAEFEAVPE